MNVNNFVTSDKYNTVVMGSAVVLFRKKTDTGSEAPLTINEMVVEHLCKENAHLRDEIERLRERGPGDPQVGYADQSPKPLPLKQHIPWRYCKKLLNDARQLLREAKPDLYYQESCLLWREQRRGFYEKVEEIL